MEPRLKTIRSAVFCTQQGFAMLDADQI